MQCCIIMHDKTCHVHVRVCVAKGLLTGIAVMHDVCGQVVFGVRMTILHRRVARQKLRHVQVSAICEQKQTKIETGIFNEA